MQGDDGGGGGYDISASGSASASSSNSAPFSVTGGGGGLFKNPQVIFGILAFAIIGLVIWLKFRK